MPFDKYKAKEDMERRLQAKNTLIFNERLSQLKQSSLGIKEKPLSGFLDRLMKKNFDLYCRDFEER